MLTSLVSMAENSIIVIDDSSMTDLDDLLKKDTFLFVSSEFATIMNGLLEQVKETFVLVNDKNQIDYQKRFDDGEDLIFELADQIYQCYKKEADLHFTFNETILGKIKIEQANQIYGILKQAYKSVIADNNHIVSPDIETTTTYE